MGGGIGRVGDGWWREIVKDTLERYPSNLILARRVFSSTRIILRWCHHSVCNFSRYERVEYGLILR